MIHGLHGILGEAYGTILGMILGIPVGDHHGIRDIIRDIIRVEAITMLIGILTVTALTDQMMAGQIILVQTITDQVVI